MLLSAHPRSARAAWAAVVLLAAFALAEARTAGGAAPLEGEALERRVLEIADQLRCPTCQAISVRDSEAPFSRQIRDKVRAMLLEGKSEDEIKATFVESYGEWILRAPKKQGVGLLLWVLPIVGILTAGALLFWRQRRIVRAAERSHARQPGTGAPDEKSRARLEQDLRRFERGF